MRRLLPYLALPLLFSSAVLAAPQTRFAPTNGRDIWNVATGYPGGYVYSVVQTDDGYIWIATSKGLLRYDGLNFVQIRRSDPNAAAKFPISGLIIDLNRQLWAVDDHTHIYGAADGQLTGPLPDNGRHLTITGLVAKDREGWLLFASELQGVVEYKHGSPKVLLDALSMPRDPTALVEMTDGTVWVGTREAGLYSVRTVSGKTELEHFEGISNVKVDCLLQSGDSTLLIGTDQGLFTLHNGKLTASRPQQGSPEILAMTNGRQGYVWIGTSDSAFRVDSKDIEAEGTIHALNRQTLDGAATALFEDRHGDLWIGRSESIERHREGGFSTYFSSAGLPCDNCGAIYVDPHQRVWFAPWDGGFFQLTPDKIQRIEAAGLKDDTVYSIAGGAKDEVWLARKRGGITRLIAGDGVLNASNFTKRDGLAQDAVDSIYRAADGAVWAGTLDKGLSRFRDGKWRTFTIKDGLPSDRISVITGNDAGNIFVGTPAGLAVLKDDRWIAYRSHDRLPPGPVESLYFDKLGTLWVGTTKGIAFLQSGTIHVPLGAPNTLYGEILGIAESNGWLWVTTHDHVVRVSRAALLNQSLGEGDYREFGSTEGLPSAEGVKRSQSVIEDTRGRIWFSLNKGISVLEPSAFATPAFPVTTRPDGILLDGRPVPPAGEIRIPSGRHRLTFRYAGVNVTNPDAVRYRYRLENVDPGWSEPTALREIDYTNVPPGQFQFHVMARNPEGVWNGNEATTNFVIEAAFWQTGWFRIISFTALALLVLGFYRMRLAQLHRQFNVGMEERIGERTRIARELHDTLLQSFHGLMFQFQAARNMLPRNPQNAMETLDDAILSTETAIAESRNAIQDLRPDSGAQRDLAQLLTEVGQELTANWDANKHLPVFRVLVEGDPRDLFPILQDEIYRIAREVIRNAFHHAAANRIEVEIRYDPRQLRLRVRDDGKGIDPQVLQAHGREGHWGLPGIRERAQRIGAGLEFWSEAGAGTEVELTIPASIAYQTRRRDSRFWVLPKGLG